MGFRIYANEVEDWSRQMARAPQLLQQALAKGAMRSAQEGARYAQNILVANGSVATGDLLRDIRARGPFVSGTIVAADYGPSSEYPARWVEEGRGPVHAREGGWLKFQIKSRGPYLYRKSVGPAAPRPFMGPSAARLAPFATATIRREVMIAFRGMV